MARYVRLRELLVGVEGLALLRRLYDGTDDEAERRITEVRRILDDEALAAGEATGEGRHRFVREHAHDHAAYFQAFGRAGLRVCECIEPRLGVEQVVSPG